jgi:hypothetical protein
MAASDRYRPVSMIVDLAEDCAAPHIFALTGPKDWKPRVARRIFHETVHYWRHISQGFLVRLAAGDWGRLRGFLADGSQLPPGAFKRRFVDPGGPGGFSVQDLVECHARFWDVQAIGPPRLIELELADPARVTAPVLTAERYAALKAEGKIWREIGPDGVPRGYSGLSFDLAMEIAAGRYARPYLMLRDRSDFHVASVVFPLAAHAALQTESPVDFYGALVERVLPKVKLPPDSPIEPQWRAVYPLVLREALILSGERYGREFTVADATIEAADLHDHPGYKLALTALSVLGRHLIEHRPGALLFAGTGMPDAMRARFTLDFLLGCAGMAESRELDLLAFLAPPVVRFAGRRRWLPGAELDRHFAVARVSDYPEPIPELGPIPGLRARFAEGLCAIDGDWSRLVTAALLRPAA